MRMIAIVDYKAGNLGSVERVLRKLGVPCRITQDPHVVRTAERVVFPGVGAAGRAMDDLRETGLDRAVREAFRAGRPVLGICLGAQIILEWSEENATPCLGLLRGKAVRFPEPLRSPGGETLKVPEMGWNGITVKRSHPVLAGMDPGDEFYFVHTYYPLPEGDRHVIAVTDYGISFPSVIGSQNLVAMQFHPEKSGAAGLRLLKNFCTWDGRDAE